MRHVVCILSVGLWAGCGALPPVGEDPDAGLTEDAGAIDASIEYPNRDEDAGEEVDAGDVDAGEEMDAGEVDAGEVDAGEEDAGGGTGGGAGGGAGGGTGGSAGGGTGGSAGGGAGGGTGVDAGLPDAGPRDAGVPDAGTLDAGWQATTSLLRPSNPLPCADPALVSENNAGQVFYVFCTSMGRVWRTSNWVTFTDVRANVTFDLTGMPTNGRALGSWWAPGVVYSPALNKYVMWVSVPDAQAVNGTNGWSARSMAVFIAPSPLGPWDYQGMAVDAAADQMFIDPFLFIDHDGGRYVYWKQYGGGVSSSIMGARVDATWTQLVPNTTMEVMNGYGGPGTWEDNVRENPAVWYDRSDGRHHMLFSGGAWRDDSYATGHAITSCGPLCPTAQTGGWHMRDSGDRNILQVVRSPGHADFINGGPGGAVFLDDSAQDIIYAAAARSSAGVTTRYLMRDRIKWLNKSPYVDTAGHEPLGY